jgi:hypothetical protein
MNDIISQTLGLQPLPDTTKPEVQELPQVESDYEFARSNLINIIEKGSDALEELITVATMSQHPRGYEVVANLIKTLSDVNKDLLDLTKKKMDISGEIGQPRTINNNLFVGSTAELQKLISDKNGIKRNISG